MLQRLKFVFSDLYWDFIHVILCCRAVLMWLRWKKVKYFNIVILKLIWIFGFILFHAPKAQICFLQSLLRFYPCCTLSQGRLDVTEVKKSEIFQFCDFKTNLHIRVHTFPCSKGSNLFSLIIIEILSMSCILVWQSWCDCGERMWVILILWS
jgi:hypothetical protein